MIKADGLAAGKGVIIASNKSDAEQALTHIIKEKRFRSFRRVLLEEFLSGEVSMLVFSDGNISCLW